MVVVAVCGRGLVARDPVPRVDALDQAKVDKGVKGAIDGRNSDRTSRAPKLVEDLVCAQAAILPSEELDDGAPGASAAVAGAGQLSERVRSPFRGLRRHEG